MCGIVGFIGQSKDRSACFDLATSLLKRTETRGDDASGYWATVTGNDDNESPVYFSKAPEKSTDFVKSDMWQAWKKADIDLLVSHCRRSSMKGSENRNINNHPFVTEDMRTALVHNGNVPEFDALREGYNVVSQCDSEILLRMMERGNYYDADFMRKQLGSLKISKRKLIKDADDDALPTWAPKLTGLMDIFARITFGAMAVAIAERWVDGTRAMWLFRDRDRPLYVVDMRKTLNQVYVVSDKKIWRDSVEATSTARSYVKPSTEIIEFPENWIWLLTLSPNGNFGVRKWGVTRQRKLETTFEAERPEPTEPKTKIKPLAVITNLSHGDHTIEHEEAPKNAVSLPVLGNAQNGKASSNGQASTNGKGTKVSAVTATGSSQTPATRTRTGGTSPDSATGSKQTSSDGGKQSKTALYETYQKRIAAMNKDIVEGDPRIRDIDVILSTPQDQLTPEELSLRIGYRSAFESLKGKKGGGSKKKGRKPHEEPTEIANLTDIPEDFHPFDRNYRLSIPDKVMTKQTPNRPDIAEIDRFNEVVGECLNTLEEIKVGIGHLVQSDSIQSNEMLQQIAQLEDVACELRSMNSVVENLPITA